MNKNTEKRKKIQIPPEDMQKQRGIMSVIRNINDLEKQKTGKEKLVLLQSYGCSQNENDTERLRGMLSDMGYGFTDDKEQADVIIYNTCAVRENAELKVFGKIGALKHLKVSKPDLIIGICGCMMQQEHIVKQIKQKYKQVDIVFGTHTLYKFPEILKRAMDETKTVIDVLDIDGYIVEDMPIKRENGIKAWVSIMYGCNNFCSYCIVPYVRGRERSRKLEDILNEITSLVQEGYKEITLLGQNVNSYGNDFDYEIDFADLLKKVNNIEGIKRIRFMTSHPKDISDKLIETISKCENVCEHLHLPFQAGSDRVLDLMNRKYTKEKYLELITKVKNAIPNIAITSDIIVGFPGENDEDFDETLDVVEKVEFDMLYTFMYSPRKGTPAEKMKDTSTLEQKQANFQRLQVLQNQISKNINVSYIGKNFEVLVEGLSKNNDEMLSGRTRSGKIVNFPGNKNLIGEFVEIEITDVHTWSLTGRRLK